jgi:hypothetical protein
VVYPLSIYPSTPYQNSNLLKNILLEENIVQFLVLSLSKNLKNQFREVKGNHVWVADLVVDCRNDGFSHDEI